jgi:X-Pro dipeptidyl-peptidase
MRLVPLAAAFALLALLPASAPAATIVEKYRVPSVGGAVINVEVVRDDQRKDQPVLLTYSPYNSLGEPSPAEDSYASRFVPRGYARAKADVIGTRDSTGCWDYGGPKEQQSGVDVVKFLAAQPWSNGRVGMIGGSYDGTTATMVAARGDDVPELKAIVPIAAISRWYGYAYQDGVRFFLNSSTPTDEGFDTPLAFDFGFGRTVGPGVTEDQKALQDRLNPCNSVQHTERGYDRTPDYDRFWLDRDYRKDADKIRAAVLLAHGWQDYNVKQDEAIGLWESLRPNVFKRLYMTQGTHGGGTSGQAWNGLLTAFLDRFLLGRETGVEDTPRVLTQRRLATDGGLVAGGFREEAKWPPPATKERRLWIRRKFNNDIPGVTLPDPGTGETGWLDPEPNTEPKDNIFTWVDTGTQTEEFTTRDPLNRPGHGYYSLYHESAPLTEPMRIAGSVVLDAHVRPFTDGATLTPVLVDVAPDGTLRTVARGFLNLDYAGGLEKAVPAGRRWVHAKVRFLPQDTTLPAGHRLGLLLQSSNAVWAVPGPAVQTNILTGPMEGVSPEGSSLRIPIAPAE